MPKKIKIAIIILLALGAVGGLIVFLGHASLPVLQPKGSIAEKERNLIIMATLLSLIVVVSVFIMLFTIAWKYRESNTKADYQPDWDHSRLFEALWWGIPCAIIFVLSVVAWQSSHELDPFKALQTQAKPVKVQVVALQWKWLFIYPDEKVASVNFLQVPINRPINFEVTSDAPMNSFWIPSLGGQIYAMSGMSTKLHLMADTPGDYQGSSANISGAGFSDMRFIARASSESAYQQWVATSRHSIDTLDADAYNELAKPTKDVLPKQYTLDDEDLYNKIIMKYMAPRTTEYQDNAMHMEMN